MIISRYGKETMKWVIVNAQSIVVLLTLFFTDQIQDSTLKKEKRNYAFGNHIGDSL